MVSMEFLPSDQRSPVSLLLATCPFLEKHRSEYWDCGDTIVFGDVTRLLRNSQLPESQASLVWKFFNELAKSGDPDALDVLATGAIESFNDDPASQSLARRYLRGDALELLEQMRVSWGQPDYGEENRK
jgi:hypothetical protein